MKVLLTVNILLVVTMAALTTAVYLSPSSKNVTYAMCQDARIYDTTHEETCHDLQSFYGYEYVCAENNNSISNKCQIEELSYGN